jgi:hypothetical protein
VAMVADVLVVVVVVLVGLKLTVILTEGERVLVITDRAVLTVL